MNSVPLPVDVDRPFVTRRRRRSQRHAVWWLRARSGRADRDADSRKPDASVVHVSSADPTQETLGLLRHYVTGKARVSCGGSTPPPVGVHVRRGEAGEAIALFASELSSDIIIVGTHKPAHLKNLFVGSTAERLMAHATCPVLVVGPKPKPAESHVIVIEAACTDCVRTRLDTRGRTWWCARHSETSCSAAASSSVFLRGPAVRGTRFPGLW